jgi:hypoxanthine-guanine phosphoribosyltransferase
MLALFRLASGTPDSTDPQMTKKREHRFQPTVRETTRFEESKGRLFGLLAGSITFHGDVVSPLNIEWDAERYGPASVTSDQ